MRRYFYLVCMQSEAWNECSRQRGFKKSLVVRFNCSSNSQSVCNYDHIGRGKKKRLEIQNLCPSSETNYLYAHIRRIQSILSKTLINLFRNMTQCPNSKSWFENCCKLFAKRLVWWMVNIIESACRCVCIWLSLHTRC